MKTKLLFAIIICSCGCATMIKARSDEEFIQAKRPVISANLGVVHSKLFVGKGDQKSFEISTNNGTYYVNSRDYGNIEISNYIVDDAKYLMDIDIFLMTRDQFEKSDIIFSQGKYSKEIYVIFNNSIHDKVVDSRSIESIYFKTNSAIRERSHIDNKLNLELGNRVLASLRSMGYIVTVPVDLITTPILAGVLLSGGIDAR